MSDRVKELKEKLNKAKIKKSKIRKEKFLSSEDFTELIIKD